MSSCGTLFPSYFFTYFLSPQSCDCGGAALVSLSKFKLVKGWCRKSTNQRKKGNHCAKKVRSKREDSAGVMMAVWVAGRRKTEEKIDFPVMIAFAHDGDPFSLSIFVSCFFSKGFFLPCLQCGLTWTIFLLLFQVTKENCGQVR